MSLWEVVALLVGLPVVAAVIAAALSHRLPRSVSRLLPGAVAVILLYFLVTLVLAWPDGMQQSPVVGLELGESPVMLFIYILAAFGALVGTLASPIVQWFRTS